MAKRLKILYAPIEKFIPYATNPVKHPESQIERLMASLNEFGWTQPLLTVSDNDFTMVAGHARLIAAKRIGLTECPYIPQTHMTPAQARAYRIADNRLAELAEPDFEMLAVEFEGLTEEGFDLDFTGFDTLERRDVQKKARQSQGSNNEGQQGENDVGEIPMKPISRPGDIWFLGDHKLICGDCSNLQTTRAVLGYNRPTLIVTSPPYNQRLNKFKPSGMHAEGESSFVRRMASAYSDDMPEPDYQKWQREILAQLRSIISPHGSLFYNHKIRYRDKQIVHPMQWVANSGWRVRQEIIWSRPGSVTQNARMFIPSDERIYWLTASDAFIFNDDVEIKSWSSVWNIAPKVDVRKSASFPVELPRRAIVARSNKSDLVFDPFSGVGTTLIACDQVGRLFCGIEIDPCYVDATIGRFIKLRQADVRLGINGPTYHEIAQQRVGDEDSSDSDSDQNTDDSGQSVHWPTSRQLMTRTGS